MDSMRFDAWTRRRFGAMTAGLLATRLSMHALGSVEAKKKKRKKRCRKLTRVCVPGGKKRCCKGLRCTLVDYATDHHCCRKTQAPCAADGECCRAHRCDEIFAGSGNRCCLKSSAACQVDDDCCGLFICFNGFCD